MEVYPILQDGSTEDDKVYALPDGWVKRIIKRLSGASAGKWDAYLSPPSKYSHKRIRSVPELMDFLKEYPDCPIDPTHVNMEKTPEIITGPPEMLTSKTKTLAMFIEKLRNGEDVSEYGQKGDSTQSNQKASGKKQKYMRKKMRPKKEQGEPLPVHLSLLQALKLEQIFHTMARVPTLQEMQEWSKKLDLSYDDVYSWFRIKWKARMEYEAERQRQQQVMQSSLDSEEEEGLLRHPIRHLDLKHLFDPLVTLKDGQSFDIVTDNGDEDNISSEEESEMDCDNSESNVESEFEEHEIDIVENPVII